MAEYLPRAAKAELQKGLAKCGSCRTRLEALQDAGLDVSAEMERLEKTQQVAERLLKLEQEGR